VSARKAYQRLSFVTKWKLPGLDSNQQPSG
jgi:hypothetical protein